MIQNIAAKENNLNLIEMLWQDLKQTVYSQKPSNVKELKHSAKKSGPKSLHSDLNASSPVTLKVRTVRSKNCLFKREDELRGCTKNSCIGIYDYFQLQMMPSNSNSIQKQNQELEKAQ